MWHPCFESRRRCPILRRCSNGACSRIVSRGELGSRGRAASSHGAWRRLLHRGADHGRADEVHGALRACVLAHGRSPSPGTRRPSQLHRGDSEPWRPALDCIAALERTHLVPRFPLQGSTRAVGLRAGSLHEAAPDICNLLDLRSQLGRQCTVRSLVQTPAEPKAASNCTGSQPRQRQPRKKGTACVLPFLTMKDSCKK